MEMLTEDIKFMNSPTINIGVFYPPPDANTMWLEKFEEYVENLTSSGHERIIMGDFNIDQLKTSPFKRSMQTLGLEQTIKVPTRVTKDSSTLIGHI
jgi:exonuclease III